MSEPITEFRGEHRFLSNFYVEPDGTCIEKEYQAAKTHDIFQKIEIMRAKDAREAKSLGQMCDLRHDWNDVKFYVMRELVLRKFYDHPELSEWLVETGDALLIEGNYWHDNYWGSCMCDRCGTITKIDFNNLGRILMEVRTLIQSYESSS